jgi:NAD-dependent dihydropyrimidine dehydrogenase PreA subunit
MRERIAEAVELPHDENVTFLQPRESIGQTGPRHLAAGDALIFNDHLAPCRLQRLLLQREVLFFGLDAGIADLHASSAPSRETRRGSRRPLPSTLADPAQRSARGAPCNGVVFMAKPVSKTANVPPIDLRTKFRGKITELYRRLADDEHCMFRCGICSPECPENAVTGR